MATIAARRAEIVTAIGSSAGVTLAGRSTPFVAVLGDGVPDMSHIVRGEVEASFRVAMIAGGPTDESSVAALDVLKQTCLTAARGLAGYRLVSLGRDGIRRIGGGDYLAADLIIAAHVTL